MDVCSTISLRLSKDVTPFNPWRFGSMHTPEWIAEARERKSFFEAMAEACAHTLQNPLCIVRTQTPPGAETGDPTPRDPNALRPGLKPVRHKVRQVRHRAPPLRADPYTIATKQKKTMRTAAALTIYTVGRPARAPFSRGRKAHQIRVKARAPAPPSHAESTPHSELSR